MNPTYVINDQQPEEIDDNERIDQDRLEEELKSARAVLEQARAKQRTGYQDPSKIIMEDGTTMLQAVGPGRRGLRGVVVPPASILGGSSFVDPESPVKVNLVSLDDNGVVESVPMYTGAINNEMTSRVASRLPPVSSVRNVEEMRQFTYMALKKMAAESTAKKNQEENPMRQQTPRNDAVPPQQIRPGVGVRNNKPVVASARPAVSPPNHRVTVNLPGKLSFETGYHDVIVSQSGSLLALVSNTAYIDPNPVNVKIDSDDEVLIDVHDSDFIYRVQYPGDRIRIHQADIQLLQITGVADKNSFAAGAENEERGPDLGAALEYPGLDETPEEFLVNPEDV